MSKIPSSSVSYQDSEPIVVAEDDPLLGPKSGKAAKRDQGNYSALNSFLIFFFPALGGLLFGYDIGATSAVISQLQSSSYSGVLWYEVVADSSLLQGVITSIGMFGAMLGSITCFKVADDLGRRRSLLVGACLFTLGSIIEYVSADSSWDSTRGIGVLLFGRATYGYACGFAMHGAPAYIGEMAPAAIRGLLVSLKEVFIVVGMVLGYSIGWYYSETKGGWRYTYGCASLLAVIMFFGMYRLPYSARWLALKGRINEAKNSMRFVTPDLPDAEIDAIRDLALKSSSFQQNSSLSDDWARLTKPTVFPALIAGVGLVIFQQITGQPSVLYYAVTIFNDVGMSSVASIAISLFKLVATLFATFTVDKYGRKLLLFIGCSMMLFALIILGTAFLFDYSSASDCSVLVNLDECAAYSCNWNTDCASLCVDSASCDCCEVGGINSQKVVILVSLFVYIGGYQVGFGPIAWLLISEIFPLEVRGKAVSIAVVMNFFFNTVMTLIFPIELEHIGASATFYSYALILAFGIYFISNYVPETKGLTLEEIEEFFLRASRAGGSMSDAGYQTSDKKGDKMHAVI